MADQDGMTKKVNDGLKQFKRIEDRSMVGGVCAGLAYRLGVATWLVRLLFFLSIWFFAVGLWAYLALWLFVPAAEKTPEDYAERTGG